MTTVRIVSSRAEFAVPDDVAYFNAASVGPLLHVVREAAEQALGRRATPWTITSEDWFSDIEVLRALVGRLFGGDADGVAFVPATSYGFGVAARNLPVPSGSRILVLAGEYPSGVYAWRAHAAQSGAEVLTVAREPGQSWTDAVLEALDEPVAIVSVPQVYWTDGAWVDLAAVAERAHQVGAALVVDASQSLGVVPLDVRALDPDFVVSVGYKWLLGPMSRSYLWVAPRHRDGSPLEQNWIVRTGAEDFTRLTDYRDEYQPGARRFDHGQRTQFELTPMAIAAVRKVLEWGVETIGACERAPIHRSLHPERASVGVVWSFLGGSPLFTVSPDVIGLFIAAGCGCLRPWFTSGSLASFCIRCADPTRYHVGLATPTRLTHG